MTPLDNTIDTSYKDLAFGRFESNKENLGSGDLLNYPLILAINMQMQNMLFFLYEDLCVSMVILIKRIFSLKIRHTGETDVHIADLTKLKAQKERKKGEKLQAQKVKKNADLYADIAEAKEEAIKAQQSNFIINLKVRESI